MKHHLVHVSLAIVVAAGIMLALASAVLIPSATGAPLATLEVDRFDDDAGAVACTLSPGDCSLRGAISNANNNPGDDTIILQAGVYTLTQAGDGEDGNATGDLDITDTIGTLSITGAGATSTIIQAGTDIDNGIDRVFDILPDAAAVLDGVGVRYGLVFDEDGGGIYNSGSITLTNSAVYSNTTQNGDGGGIYTEGSAALDTVSLYDNATIDGGFFTDFGDGGGLYSNGGSVTIDNSEIHHNTALFLGGGVFNGGDMMIESSTIYRNLALDGHGGGILNGFDSVMDVSMSKVYLNEAWACCAFTGNGGGIASGGIITLTQSYVYSNTADANGGGLFLWKGNVTIEGTEIYGNEAAEDGGGLASLTHLVVTNSDIYENYADDDGGGMDADGPATFVINTSIRNNEAGGSGGALDNDGPTEIQISELVSNTAAGGDGGAIKSSAVLTIAESTIAYNSTSVGHGGGIALNSGRTSIAHSEIYSNAAADEGGGIYNKNRLIVLTSTVAYNRSAGGGGGIRSWRSAATTIVGSTIHGNQTVGDDDTQNPNGGGVSLGACGIARIFNSTISGNEGLNGGGVSASSSSSESCRVTIRHTTITDNVARAGGGGVVVFPRLTGFLKLVHTIVSGNQATDGSSIDCLDAAILNSGGYNVIGSNGNAGGCVFDDAPVPTTDIVPTMDTSAIVDPTLAENGGKTQTHALINSGSNPALNAIPVVAVNTAVRAAGGVDCPEVDQRGVIRPHGGGCDIGPYESDLPLAIALGWFLARNSGDWIDFRWQTATEMGTAGFNLLAMSEAGKTRLNDTLIPSSVIDAVTPTDYAFTATTDATRFYLEEVSINGDVTEHGPFELDREHGVYDAAGNPDLRPVLWLPLILNERDAVTKDGANAMP